MSRQNHNLLVIYTSSFPYGPGESFMLAELSLLKQQYSEIVFVPLQKSGQIREGLPLNSKVWDIASDESVLSSKKSMLFNLLTILQIFKLEWKSKQRKYWLKNWKYFFVQANKCVNRSKLLIDKLSEENIDPKEVHHYSFWMNDWAVALSVLKKQKAIQSFITRVNGFDIFDERRPGNYMPFKIQVYKYSKYVLANSNRSKSYLQSKGVFPSKVIMLPPSTEDIGFIDYKLEKPFVIISSGRMIPLKRVELIPDILKNIDVPIHWKHIGSGETEELVLKACENLPTNISYSQVPFFDDYESYVDFLSSSNAACFIHLSTTEGMGAVAIEALSLGVPILMTDVGGAPEFIEDDAGSVMIPVDFNATMVAQDLKNILKGSANDIDQRLKRKENWKTKFSNVGLVPKLIKLLKENT